MESAQRRLEREVRDLHRFLEGWLGGRLPDGDAAFAPFPDALGPDFVIISPGGTATGRAALCRELRAAHGVHAAGDFRIRIENCRLRAAGADFCLGTYEEWQELAGRTTARLGTVFFRAEPSARHGLCWHHLHETWLPGHAPEAPG